VTDHRGHVSGRRVGGGRRLLGRRQASRILCRVRRCGSRSSADAGSGRSSSLTRESRSGRVLTVDERLPPGRGSALFDAGAIVQPARCASESLPVGGVAPLVDAIGADVLGVQFLPNIGAQGVVVGRTG
jgi:hypothetical protein